MENPRVYGLPPYKVAVVHGGPGAPGTMAPVARELTRHRGVIEPLQTAKSLEGQVAELGDLLANRANPPVVLIGSSWGAMLGFIVAARFPELVRKLIMIGSGVFEAKYAAGIDAKRLSRLSEEDRAELDRMMAELNDASLVDRNALFGAIGHIFTKTDAYDPITLDTEMIGAEFDTFEQVWSEVEAFRAGGDLLALGSHIRCPVVAIHGDYDPHPIEGIREPLSRVLADFRMIVLPECGHLPWIERRARDRFFQVLEEEIRR